MATCIICDNEFKATRSDAKLCSPQCRQQAKRKGIKLRGKMEKELETSLNAPGHNQKVKAALAELVTAGQTKNPYPVKEELYMGQQIPTGLSGIPLAVWKNNIKVAAKNAAKLKK